MDFATSMDTQGLHVDVSASTNAIAHLPRNLHGSASSTGTMARMP
jgi:hypothetical protein